MKMSLAHCNPQEWPLVPRLCVRKASSREQEEAVSNAIEAVLRKVLEAIREHELDELGYKYSSTFVAESVLRVYTLANIRYDLGKEEGQVLSSAEETLSTDIIKDDSIIAPMAESTTALTETASSLTGTLLPSPEPQPATIDRWARGWLSSRSVPTERECSQARHERSRPGDDWSDGSPSIRSVKSMPSTTRLYRQPSRKRSAAKEDKPAVPFPLDTDTREDQGLPPATLPLGRDVRVLGRRGVDCHGGSTNESRNVTGSRRGEDENKDFKAWLEELGGREWTVDGSGELLVVDKPCGEGKRTKAKAVVDALYTFRDTTGSAQHHGETHSVKTEPRPGGEGGDKASDHHHEKRTSSSLVKLSERSVSRSASRRTSTRQSSKQRLDGKNERFFTLEPTLQPNIIHSMGQPGPGVSVSDGSATKDGPSWPQDPNHMSISEYRQQRQRRMEHSATMHSLVGKGDGEISSLGFSLGTVQSAPTLGGFRHGMKEGGGGGEGFGGKRTARKLRADTAGHNPYSRGDSFITFEDVDPYHGGVTVPSSSSVAGSSRRERGESSPLSTALSRGGLFEHGGPESEQEPSFGYVGRGSPTYVGLLPKVKHKPRERPSTHNRPPTRDLHDPKRVLARKQLRISPKIICKGTGDRDNTVKDPRRRLPKGREDNFRAGDIGREEAGSSSSTKPPLSFPPLPVLLSGWEAPQGVIYGTDYPWNDEVSRKDYISSSRSGVITMMKPREKLLKGLLRRRDGHLPV